MKPAPKYDELDRLLVSARAQEPAPMSDFAARRMVRQALAHAQTERAPRRRHARWYWALAAVLVVGFVAVREAWPAGTVLSVDPGDQPLRIALLPGDAVTMAPGAKLELLSQTRNQRRIHLTRGAALFDVVKLRAGEHFEVVTNHGSVRVMGTVFSVEVFDSHAIVRVYEGRVQAAHGSLGAGSVWSTRGDKLAGPDPLATQAALAVHARDTAGAAEVSVQALVSPLPLEADAGAPTPVPAPPATSITPPSIASDAGSPEPSIVLDLQSTKLLLERGDALEALARTRTALQQQPPDQELPWRSLEASALRALGRFGEAAVSYERAAGLARAGERLQFAYDAAALDLEGLQDPARALVLIDRWGLDAFDSPLRERAGRLRVHALLALHRMDDARKAARRYLDLEPETAVSEEMRKLLGW